MAIRKIVSRSILDGAIAPVDTTGVATPTTLTVSGISTFPDLGSVQVTAPNRHSVDASLLLDFANTKTLDPRITFTRGSSATYYDGTTAMAEQNLLLQSQTFDNGSWTKQAVTVTADSTTAPDGTTTAETLANSATTAQFWMYQALTLPIGSTLSIYAKAGTANFIGMSSINGNTNAAVFNLSTGAVASSATDVTASIVSVGNGWYRCSIVNNTYAGNYVVVSIQESDLGSGSIGSYTGTGKNIYIWGIQAEARRTLTAYTATTTTAITNYIPVLKTAGPNQARFDVDPITLESKGLLLEEQRTNVATYSGDLGNNSAWPPAGVITTSNVNVAPDGSLSAMSLISSTSGGDHNLYRIFGLSATAYTFSVYAKYSGENLALSAGASATSGVPWTGCIFDLQNGIAKTPQGSGITCTPNIQSVGNGWYRCSITFTPTSASYYLIISTTNNVNATMGTYGFIVFTGNSWNGVQLWGCQLEAGSFPTSYIPTAASSVTRTFDYPVISGSNFSSWFNNTAGTVYVEVTAPLNAATGGAPFVYLVDSAQGAQNDIYMDIDVGAARFYAFDRGSLTTSINLSTATAGTSYKVAAAYKLNDYAASKNGGAVVTDTSANVPAGLSQMIIGRDIFNALSLNSTIKKIAYYPIRLTNAELIGMTTA